MNQRVPWIWPNIHHISLEVTGLTAKEKFQNVSPWSWSIFLLGSSLRTLRALREKHFSISSPLKIRLFLLCFHYFSKKTAMGVRKTEGAEVENKPAGGVYLRKAVGVNLPKKGARYLGG